MEIMLFEPKRFNLLYNCSFYDYNIIPVEKRQHKFLGVVIIICYVIFMPSYLACLYAMLNKDLRKKASYRLMFLLGVIHILDLQFCGLMTGVFAIVGVVYCQYPLLIYVSGSFAVGELGGICSRLE
jgi:uncharacterized membrane protein YesL